MLDFQLQLEKRKKDNLWRTRLCIDQRDHAFFYSEQKKYLSFINNDYLGLATHPALLDALQEGARCYGIGSSASQLLGGYYHSHQALEQAIAAHMGFERALIFPTGYLANYSVINTLIKKQDAIFAHRLNHASLIDGAQSTGARVKRFLTTNQLAQQLEQSSAEKKWVISDAVFSMDGTIAPLPEYAALATHHQAKLIIDDAHGFGVLGEQGAGIFEHYGLTPTKNIIVTATFGKACGSQGAFVAADALIIDYLLQYARGYIYNTALSPALACANLAALNLIKTETWRRTHLQTLIAHFQAQAKTLSIPAQITKTPIQIIILQDSAKTLAVANALKHTGIAVGAIRPPTVADHTARLRINLSTHHTKQDIDFLVTTLRQALDHVR